MTAQDIVKSVDTMLYAANQAMSHMGPLFGCCAASLGRERGYCTEPRCGERQEHYAAEWARAAAHEADNLIELAIEITESRLATASQGRQEQ